MSRFNYRECEKKINCRFVEAELFLKEIFKLQCTNVHVCVNKCWFEKIKQRSIIETSSLLFSSFSVFYPTIRLVTNCCSLGHHYRITQRSCSISSTSSVQISSSRSAFIERQIHFSLLVKNYPMRSECCQQHVPYLFDYEMLKFTIV